MIEERNITITLDKAREWFNNGDATLKDIALQAFKENELKHNFKNITTFKKACKALGLDYEVEFAIIEDIARISSASAAMFKLNIIRKALNLGYNLPFVQKSETSCIYYPYNPFITEDSTYYKDKLYTGEMEIIGKIRSKGILYNVIGGVTSKGSNSGLGEFICSVKVGTASTSTGFLGCASREIAQHFGKYFGMLITEAKYSDLTDLSIIEDKYGNS